MRFLDRDELLSAMARLAATQERSDTPSQPYLNCVLIEAGERPGIAGLTTSKGVAAQRVEVALDSADAPSRPCGYLLEAKRFREILKQLPGSSPVQVRPVKGALEVSAGNTLYKVPAGGADEYPPFLVVPKEPMALRVSAEEMLTALDCVCFASNPDNPGAMTRGVAFEYGSGAGAVMDVVATDGTVVARYPVALRDPQECAGAFHLQADQLDPVREMLAESVRRQRNSLITVGVGGPVIHFCLEREGAGGMLLRWTISLVTCFGRTAPWRRILRSDHAAVFACGKAELERALQAAAVVGVSEEKAFHPVELAFDRAEVRVSLRTQNGTCDTAVPGTLESGESRTLLVNGPKFLRVINHAARGPMELAVGSKAGDPVVVRQAQRPDWFCCIAPVVPR